VCFICIYQCISLAAKKFKSTNMNLPKDVKFPSPGMPLVHFHNLVQSSTTNDLLTTRALSSKDPLRLCKDLSSAENRIFLKIFFPTHRQSSFLFFVLHYCLLLLIKTKTTHAAHADTSYTVRKDLQISLYTTMVAGR
jgi:hypothetical protein